MVGLLLGVNVMFAVLSLENAIYWGRLANCQEVIHLTDVVTISIEQNVIDQYTCVHKPAMKSVCAFASIQFATYLFSSGFMALRIDDILDSGRGNKYNDVSESNSGSGEGIRGDIYNNRNDSNSSGFAGHGGYPVKSQKKLPDVTDL